MDERKLSSRRRLDVVSYLAMALFLLIVVFQTVLVTWLPAKISTEKIWDRQVALQEMINLQDLLRGSIRSGLKFADTWQEGEAFIAMLALDEYARYMRTYEDTLTRDQIREVYTNLLKFEVYYENWKAGKFNIQFAEIRLEPILQNQLQEYREWEKQHGSDRYP